jgi:hypothetical protein
LTVHPWQGIYENLFDINLQKFGSDARGTAANAFERGWEGSCWTWGIACFKAC